MVTLTKLSGWLDINAHFCLPSTEAERVEKWQAMRAAKFLAPERWDWKVSEVVSYMDPQEISMQFLSNTPNKLDALTASNDYGVEIVRKYQTRFVLLAALPTDDLQAAIGEVKRMEVEEKADGWAVSTCCNGVYLGDERLDRLWEVLDRKGSVVFVHPNVYEMPMMTQPTPLVEVAFDTTKTVIDMRYKGVFRRHKGIRWALLHCGGALPALSGRVFALGVEEWMGNSEKVGVEEMGESLGRFTLTQRRLRRVCYCRCWR